LINASSGSKYYEGEDRKKEQVNGKISLERRYV
jgi:hypothetical protein